MTSDVQPTVMPTDFQPWWIARVVSVGKKMSWPVALPAVSMPMTRPFFAINQRFAIFAAKTKAIEPVPTPTTTPHVSMRCHGFEIKSVENEPMLTQVRAAITTLRTVKRSISAAANGAVRPKSKTLRLIAAEIEARDQPKASCSGMMRTDGAER